MKRIQLLTVAALSAATSWAQLNGDGYYRVQNEKTTRFITVVDNRGSVNMSTTDADLNALRTVMGFERVVSDPASVVYIMKMSKGYDLQSQGMSTYKMIKRELMIYDWEDGTYSAYATESGMTKYLDDVIPSWMLSPEEKIYGTVCTNSPNSRYWLIQPLKSTGDNYFGLTPDINAGGRYYKTFYTSFPFSFASSAMKAYYVTKVDASRACVVVREMSSVVPGGTPVIVESTSGQAADNKLDLLTSSAKAPADNQLTGVYFCNPDAGSHTNVVAYNASTMRVLGKAADGSLAFVRQSDLKHIPANTAYLTVPLGTPTTLKVLTETEYSKMLSEAVTITANSYTRHYGEDNPEFGYTISGAELMGTPALSCPATATSPVGRYPIRVAVGSVTNGFTTLADGVLTITPAELTVSAADVSREEGQENPEFVLTYEGFVNGETESVLRVRPTASTTATKDSPVGDYAITVAGGQADNYVFSYVNGTLTVNVVSAVNAVQAGGGPVVVYDVYGRRVLSDARSSGLLRKGVYIINGRKVVVK